MKFTKPLKLEELKALLEVVNKYDNIRDKCLVFGLLYSGFRISDFLSLPVSKIDLASNTISTRESKTGKLRVVPIHSEFLPILKQYLMNRQTKRSSDKLFNITRGAAWSILQGYAKLSGISQLSPHSLRKTLARKIWEDSGHKTALVSRLLNHTSEASTLRYIAVSQEEINNAVLNVEF